MSFLSPLFLFALFAVGLPLLIHLLNLKKPKRIAFSTLAFFNELQKSTIRKIRIKKYLLLILRLLAVACLALVLARPFLPPILGIGGNTNQATIIAIVVDNSISMARIGSKGPLLEQAKSIINDIVTSAKADDKFLIQVTNGEGIISSTLSGGQVNRELDKLSINVGGNYLPSRVGEIIQSLTESPFQNKRLFIISDGQFPINEDLTSAVEKLPESIAVSLVKLEDVSVQNTFIQSVSSPTSMIGAGIPYQLQVQVSNSGVVLAANQFLTLEMAGETLGQYPIQLAPGETQSFSFALNPEKTGSMNGMLMLEGDEFTLDNKYFFTIVVPDQRRVLLVSQKGQRSDSEISYTQAILDAPDNARAQLKYTSINNDELSNTQFLDYDAIILDGLRNIPEYTFEGLQNFVQSGKGLLVFPSQQTDIPNYNAFLNLFNAGKIVGVIGDYASFNSVAIGTELQEDHPIFSGLFDRSEDEELRFTKPDIYYYYKMAASSSGSGINLLTLNTRDPLFREKEFGQGKVLISTIGNDPGWSNFPVKALYAPFYYRSILYAASSQQGGFALHELGNSFVWKGKLSPNNTKLIANGDEITVTPLNLGGEIRIEYSGQEWQPGWILLSDGEKEFTVSANLPASESNFLKDPALQELQTSNTALNLVDAGKQDSQTIAQAIKNSGFGREIWHWFMLAGLLLLIVESLVSIYFKAETIS
tara:strand:+ start:20110 stop:22221 length:2112 start_codon:yes stop_codon:yes gene_type:complete